jgi:translation initiation factor IF-3-like protein
VTVRFRGRELTHPEIGRNLIARFVDRVKDHGVAERTPLLEGKSMHITMASLHKPKSHDAPDRKHAPGVTPEDATAETPPAPDTKTVVPQPAAVAPPKEPAVAEPVQATGE